VPNLTLYWLLLALNNNDYEKIKTRLMALFRDYPGEITTPAPHHSVFLQAGCPSCRPTKSVKAPKAKAPKANDYDNDVNQMAVTQ